MALIGNIILPGAKNFGAGKTTDYVYIGKFVIDRASTKANLEFGALHCNYIMTAKFDGYLVRRVPIVKGHYSSNFDRKRNG